MSVSVGVDWVGLCVWVREVIGLLVEDIIIVETDVSAEILEVVLLGASVWVDKRVIDKLLIDDVIFTNEWTDVGVTGETFGTDSILLEGADTYVVDMTLSFFILDVTAIEFEIDIESLELEINVDNGLLNL